VRCAHRGGVERAAKSSSAVPSASPHDPSFERELLRKALFALGAGHARCVDCRRTPLTGELMHVLDSGRELCSLCLARSAGREGEPVRSERVHAGERRLAVVPRAA
jgi:hypothetical protein